MARARPVLPALLASQRVPRLSAGQPRITDALLGRQGVLSADRLTGRLRRRGVTTVIPGPADQADLRVEQARPRFMTKSQVGCQLPIYQSGKLADAAERVRRSADERRVARVEAARSCLVKRLDRPHARVISQALLVVSHERRGRLPTARGSWKVSVVAGTRR